MASYVNRNNESYLNELGFTHMWINHSLYWRHPLIKDVHT